MRDYAHFELTRTRKSTEESTSSIPVEGSKPRAIPLERRDWRCTFRSRVRPFRRGETKSSLADPEFFFVQCNCGIVRTSLSSFCVVPSIVLIFTPHWQGLDPCRLPGYSTTRTCGESTALCITSGSAARRSSAYYAGLSFIAWVVRTAAIGITLSCFWGSLFPPCGLRLILISLC